MKPSRVTVGFNLRGWKEIQNIEFDSAQIIGAKLKEYAGITAFYWEPSTGKWIETNS